MNINIRSITKNDIPSVIELMREFAEFEKLTASFEITEEKLAGAIFAKAGFVQGLVADDDGAIIGFALFYPHFSSFRAQSGLFLEDLYIKAEYRGKGVGEAMIKKIAKIAKSRGFERIDFQVLDWNTPAIKFYEKLGAVRDIDERHFKYTDSAFDLLATDH